MSVISHTRAVLVAVALLIPALALAQSAATGVSGVVQGRRESARARPRARRQRPRRRTRVALRAATYADGRYLSFKDAPPPLEDTGGPQVRDNSGSVLPGISKWAYSLGGEYVHRRSIAGAAGELFGALDTSYRSSFSSSATASRYLVVDGYTLLNVRAGFRASSGWTVFLWSRNLTNKDYYELLTAAPGNTGLFVGQPGDPRSVGVTLRLTLRRN